MKKLLLRLTLLCVLFSMSLSDTVMAQRHYSRPYHRQNYRGRGDGFYRSLRTAEAIGETAMFGAFLHQLDDYTGIRVGYNAASLRTDLKYGNVTSEFTSGISVGVVFGWQLGHTPLIIEPGLYYSMKGGKLNGKYDAHALNSYLDHGNTLSYINNVTMHNFEIPLVLKCDLPLTPDHYVKLQPFFGGFLSFGFGGKTKYEDAIGRDVYSTFGDDLFGSTDAGLRMGLGLAAGMFYLEAAYDLGLVNLPENKYNLMGFDDFSDSMKSNTISFSFGVNF